LAYTEKVKYSFEWDDDKDEENADKHGIWFEEAKRFGLIPMLKRHSILTTVRMRIDMSEWGFHHCKGPSWLCFVNAKKVIRFA
jgi:hypothetical protein